MFTVSNSQMQMRASTTFASREKAKQILFHLCRVILNHQSTPETVFQNYNKYDLTLIDFIEFGVMLRQMDPSLSSLDLQIVFQQFDQMNQYKITFLHFKQVFLKHYNEYIVLQQQEEQELSMDIKLDYKNKLVYAFARECEKNRTDIKKLFNDFANQDKMTLRIQEFSQIMKNVDQSADQYQIKAAFDVFDLQQDQQITFVEFQTTIQRFSTQTRGLYIIIQEIRKHNIDLERFFGNFNKGNQETIDFNEFSNMIKRIIQDFTNNQIELIFRKFDQQGQRVITFQRFKDVIHKYYFEDTVPDMKTDNAIEKLVKEIKKNDLDPQVIFNNYDRQHDTHLDMFEFGILLRQIDQTLTEKEIQLAFNKFDVDKDKCITFKEFVNTLSIVYQINIMPFERKNHAVKKLTVEIINSGQDLEKLFKEIDLSGDKLLDIFEFGTLLTKIDSKLGENEIELAFREFDLDGDRYISYSEFKNTLAKIHEESAIQITKSNKAIKKIVDMVRQMNIDIHALFNEYDVSGDNLINGMEFIQMMKGFDQTLSDQELQDAFYEFDKDRDGQITFQEFNNCLQRFYTKYGQASL